MTFTDTFATPDDTGPIRASELHSSLGESLGAQAAEALDPQSGISAMQLWRRARSAMAGGDMLPGLNAPDTPLPGDVALFDSMKSEIPDVSMADAKAQVKSAGLEGSLPLPDQPSIKAPVLDLMIQEAQEHRDRQAAIARGPQGFLPDALGFMTSVGAGMIDPVNAAAFSIPVLGEARWGALMARAGDSLLARTGVRALQGAVQGAAGTTALQPFDYLMHTADGRDYTMADALRSVVLGAGMGGAFHATFGRFGGGDDWGLIGDTSAKLRGRPLPGAADATGPGNAQPVGETQLEGQGVASPAPGEEVPGLSPSSAPAAGLPAAGEPFEGVPEAYPPGHPASVLADLPPTAREDVARSAMADVINGRPVRAAEMLQEAAKVDPRIAETVDAWHGSPHSFDAFSLDHIGSGEGADTYGHGLYFAENQNVAAHYQTALSPAPTGEMPAEVRAALKSVDNLGFESSGQAIVAVRTHPADWMKRWDVDPRRSPGEAGAVDTISKYVRESQRGNLYGVRIKASPADMLDWDANARHQPPGLALAYERLGLDLSGATDGGDAYHQLATQLGSRKAASDALRAAGVPGIRYFDQDSRHLKDQFHEPSSVRAIERTKEQIAEVAAELRDNEKNPSMLAGFFERKRDEISALQTRLQRQEQALEDWRSNKGLTRNYVLFSDKDIEITHKNGVPVSRAEAKAVKAEKRAAKAQSLLEFIRAKGGVSEDDPLAPDLLQSFGGENPNIRGKGKLVRPDGLSLDRLREAAVEAGYLHDQGEETGGASHSTIQDLLDAVDQEARGNRQYPRGDELAGVDEDAAHLAERSEAEREIYFHQAGEDIDRLMDANGVNAIRPQIKNFALRLLERGEARDAEDAFHQSLDNFDMLGGREQLGDADMADWQQFADATPDYEDPQLVAESKEAATTPEPGSIAPAKAPSAAEAAAAEADKVLEDMRPMLTDDERQQIDEVLQQLDREREDRGQIIKEGAACLAAAAA